MCKLALEERGKVRDLLNIGKDLSQFSLNDGDI